MESRENSALTSADPAGRMPAVSVLVVNYRASRRNFDACLSSLGRQHVKVEVIVVDQETDEPRRCALEQRHPHTLFIPLTTNTGFAAGINTAARHASGTFLYIVNPDAVVAPDTTATLAEWLGHQPTVGVVGSLVLDVDGSIQGSARAFPDPTTFFSGRTAWITRAFPANPLSRRNVLTGSHVTEPVAVDWVSARR